LCPIAAGPNVCRRSRCDPNPLRCFVASAAPPAVIDRGRQIERRARGRFTITTGRWSPFAKRAQKRIAKETARREKAVNPALLQHASECPPSSPLIVRAEHKAKAPLVGASLGRPGDRDIKRVRQVRKKQSQRRGTRRPKTSCDEVGGGIPTSGRRRESARSSAGPALALGWSLRTRDTRLTSTPARAATSRIVVRLRPGRSETIGIDLSFGRAPAPWPAMSRT